MSCDIREEISGAEYSMARLSVVNAGANCADIENQIAKKPYVRSKGETRGQKLSGLTHECGVFGCIAAGDWPSPIDVGQVICLGMKFEN